MAEDNISRYWFGSVLSRELLFFSKDYISSKLLICRLVRRVCADLHEGAGVNATHRVPGPAAGPCRLLCL
jgi:hypothetical protein